MKKKTFTLAPEEAYGNRDENQIHDFPKDQIPPGMDPKNRRHRRFPAHPKGQQIPARLIEKDDEKLTFDLNHPLAGQTLTFNIEIVGIGDAPSQPSACGGGCDCSSGCSC